MLSTEPPVTSAVISELGSLAVMIRARPPPYGKKTPPVPPVPITMRALPVGRGLLALAAVHAP